MFLYFNTGIRYYNCAYLIPLFSTCRYEEMIVDNTCMQLTSWPDQFDVMVSWGRARVCSLASGVNAAIYECATYVCMHSPGELAGRELML